MKNTSTTLSALVKFNSKVMLIVYRILVSYIVLNSFQKADLAVGDLTITYERESGVDFTMPFMNLGTLHLK